jgi:hypothetical protein
MEASRYGIDGFGVEIRLSDIQLSKPWVSQFMKSGFASLESLTAGVFDVDDECIRKVHLTFLGSKVLEIHMPGPSLPEACFKIGGLVFVGIQTMTGAEFERDVPGYERAPDERFPVCTGRLHTNNLRMKRWVVRTLRLTE